MSDCMSLKYDSLFGQISSLEDAFGCASTAYLTCSSKVLFLISFDLPAYITHLPRATIDHLVRLWQALSCSLLNSHNLDTNWFNLSSICISSLTQRLNSFLHSWNCCMIGRASGLQRLRCLLLLFLLLCCWEDINMIKNEPFIRPLGLFSGINIGIRHTFTM